RVVMGSPYMKTSIIGVVPPLVTPPSDFSKTVVIPPALLPGAGLFHRLDPTAIPFPPFVAIDELLGDTLIDGSSDEQVLRAVDLRRLRQHAGAALALPRVHRPAEREDRPHAGGGVGAAAGGGEVARRDGPPGAPEVV